MTDLSRIALVLLAAGRATRFGAAKLAQPLAGRPLAHHAAAAFATLPFAARIAVVRAETPPLAPFGYEVVPLDPPDAPMSRSLALGIAAVADRDIDMVIVALADMPLVPPEHLRALAAAGNGARIGTLVGSVLGPPALFPRADFPALRTLSGDRGARALLGGANAVPLDPALALDVDTPADLARAQARLR